MSQSFDATCYGGLTSPTDGFQTFKFSHASPVVGFRFPLWTIKFSRLLSFDFSKLYSFDEDHTVLTISNYTHSTKESHVLSKIYVMEVIESRPNRVKMIIKTLTDCQQAYKCAILHRRSDHVLELEEGLRTRALRVACAEANFVAGSLTNQWSLLLEEGLGSVECPVTGIHDVTSLSLASQTQLCDLRGFNRLEIGCSSSERVQFIRECSGRNLSD